MGFLLGNGTKVEDFFTENVICLFHQYIIVC